MLLERFEPWMPMYFFEGSIGGDIEQILLNGIREFYGAGVDRAAACRDRDGRAQLATAVRRDARRRRVPRASAPTAS